MANDNTSKAYIEILTPAKDGAAYVDSYGYTLSEYAPNFNVNDRNTICFRAAGISMSSITKIVIQNVKIYYREQGTSSWSVYNYTFKGSTTSTLASIDQRILGSTDSGGLPFHVVFTGSNASMSDAAKLFTTYEWYVYAEYVITYNSSVSTSYGSSGTTKTANQTSTEDTSTYTLNSHVRRTIFLPKTTTGSLRARVNSSTTEVYPAFNYSTDPSNTPSLKMNIGGTVSKVALVSSSNPLAGKTKMRTNSETKHLAKRDPSIADSGIGWNSYGAIYSKTTNRYFTNPAQQYISGYHYTQPSEAYRYNYYGYNTVDNKAYIQERYTVEYYNTDKNYAGNYKQYITGYNKYVQSYKISGYTISYDKQYNQQNTHSYNMQYYNRVQNISGYHYYWAQYQQITDIHYYDKEYYSQTRTYSYPLGYTRYSYISGYSGGSYISDYVRKYLTKTAYINVTTKTYGVHTNVSTTAYQYQNAPASGGAAYVIGRYLIPNGNYTGYYTTSTTNPSFYEVSSYNYTFAYNYTYGVNEAVYTTVYTTLYRYDYAATGYAWNYVQNKLYQHVYASTTYHYEPVYTSLTQVTDYRIDNTGPFYSNYTYYSYTTLYNGKRENPVYAEDRVTYTINYRQDLVKQYSYKYNQYWDGSTYYHTYPQYYVPDATAYRYYNQQHTDYAYRYGGYTLSNTTYSQYYKYLNMRE